MTVAGASRRGALLVLALGLLAATGPFSLDAYLPALPAIALELGTSTQVIQLSLTACLVGLAAGQLVVGPIGDRFGRRTPMLVGALVYAAASIGCALAPAVEPFVALRFVQGLAGASALVLSRAVVQDVASGAKAAWLFSQMSAVSSTAPVLAPVIGVAVIATGGWRSVFVLLAILGLLMACAVLLIGETRPPAERTSAAIGRVLGSFGLLMRDRAFLASAVVVMFTSAVLFSYISSAPFVVQTAYGASALEFALCFALIGASLVVAGLVTARLTRLYAPGTILEAAVVVQFAGIVAVALVVALRSVSGFESLPLLVACLVWAIGPCAAVLPLSISLAMGRAGARPGSASALLGAAQFLIGGLASPLSGAGEPVSLMSAIMLVAGAGSLSIVLVRANRDRRRRRT
jgi:DHA1 family bicyclomycin/chloramphenicol resistance-like MFS transporter